MPLAIREPKTRSTSPSRARQGVLTIGRFVDLRRTNLGSFVLCSFIRSLLACLLAFNRASFLLNTFSVDVRNRPHGMLSTTFCSPPISTKYISRALPCSSNFKLKGILSPSSTSSLIRSSSGPPRQQGLEQARKVNLHNRVLPPRQLRHPMIQFGRSFVRRFVFLVDLDDQKLNRMSREPSGATNEKSSNPRDSRGAQTSRY